MLKIVCDVVDAVGFIEVVVLKVIEALAKNKRL